jgi:hypothetical protein
MPEIVNDGPVRIGASGAPLGVNSNPALKPPPGIPVAPPIPTVCPGKTPEFAPGITVASTETPLKKGLIAV